MTQVNEYGWAMAGLVLCGVCCLGQLYVWTASPNRFRNTAAKSVLAFLSVTMIVISGLTVIKIKGEKPWSNLLEQNKKSSPPQVNSTSTSSPVASDKAAQSTAQPPAGDTQGRIFLDIAPEKLLDFFEKYNEAQAENLIRPYMGTWVELSGTVIGVRREALLPQEGDRTLRYGVEVTFSGPRADRPKTRLVHRALFEEQRWMDRAVVLKPNEEHIKVRGTIKYVFFYGFYLEHCEIIE